MSYVDYPTSGTYSGVNEKLASQKQIKYYLDLCENKKVEPRDVSNITSKAISELINEVKLVIKPSQSQIDMLVKLSEETEVILTDQLLENLTGGKEGTASKLIEQLIERKRKMGNVLPPTDAQVKFLTDMFLCPDIPFEEYEIQKKRQIGDNTYVLMTPTEFAIVAVNLYLSKANSDLSLRIAAKSAFVNTLSSLVTSLTDLL